MAVTGWFVALLCLGVVPVVAVGADPSRSFAVLAGWIALSILLLVIDVALAGSPRSLRITRSIADRVRLGEATTSELLIVNTGRRTVRALVRDGWQPTAGAPFERSRVIIPAGERRRIEQTLRPVRRGERRSEHVTVRSVGPLHLGARQATIASRGVLRVLPPFNARKHLPSRLARLRELDGATSVMVRGQGTEFDSLREYVRGDDVRSIDWRATARRSDLVVRTWRPERDRRVVVVVDTARTSAARIADEVRLDTAFEATLLLSALATRADDRVDFLAVDRRVRGRVTGATGADLLAKLVDSMADIDPDLIEMDWDAVPGHVRQITSRHAFVVLLTSIETPGASSGLLAVLPQLTRSHTVAVVSVTDPAVIEARNDRGDREAVYRAAAAERAVLDAARVAAAVRRSGADVVTGSPSDLPPALADHYLALKAAGRL
ncbi:DUF58 domain-containing protein [Labedella phragmitis]|uniref:DUF58 domain-containing protein n=1 Tax=Labedella phragmitis TaxID=2498849 RepID=A0A3S3Z2L1_9MICO|nr:DUF58 domain-containing protein [Labedella phragmitis]RWZ46382.1 DUF58 domain-containing protein [Labedella phragmitis]